MYILKRGDTKKLTEFDLDEDTIEEIDRIVKKKNREYRNKKKYSLPHDVLKFNKEKLTLKATDYFGYIRLQTGVLIKSDGDYLLEYEQNHFYITQKDIQSIIETVNKESVKINVVGYKKGSDVKDVIYKDGSYLLKATSYVGVVSLPSGFRIQIIPKISNTALYYMMCYIYDIDISIFDESNFPQGRMFLDIIAFLFKSELEAIIQQGLFKKYVIEEENLNFLRGKLQVNKQIKRNFINRHHFYCNYDELTYDNLENQTILYALNILQELAFLETLKESLLDLRWTLEEEVSSRRFLGIEDVNNISFSKLNDYYEKIIKLSKQIIQEIFITDIQTKEVQAFGYLVNMNQMFQDFIAKIIEKEVYRTLPQFEVKTQKKGINNLLKPIGNANRVTVKPDILISRRNTHDRDEGNWVIDTKYKKIMDFGREKAKAKSPDLYQAIAYSLAYKRNSMLIYPQEPGAGPTRYSYEFNPELIGLDWKIFVITIDISCDTQPSDEGFNQFKNKITVEIGSEIKPENNLEEMSQSRETSLEPV